MSTSNQKRATSRNKKNKGLAMGFASRQRETIDASGQQLNDRLAALQRGQEELEREREELDALRQRLADAPPPSSPGTILLPLADLRLSGDTQSRVHLDPSIVSEYMERMIVDEQSSQVLDPEGNPWEPIKVYREESGEPTGSTSTLFWVADGFHRASAARELGLEQFPCIVLEGTQRDAVRESLSANARHGLRRTRADKRRAVERALHDPEWRTWTDQRLADLCAVSRSMVSKTREELESTNAISFEIALYGADGREFEREPPVTTGASSARQEVSDIKKARQTGAPRGATTAPVSKREVCSWKEAPSRIEKIEQDHVVVAYPEVASHYELLRDALREECAPAHILLPLLDGSEWFWRGPAIMHDLVERGLFAQPVVLSLADLDKHFVCWNRRDLDTPLCGTIARAHFASQQALILGTSLDDW